MDESQISLFQEYDIPSGAHSLLLSPPSLQSLYIEMLSEAGATLASGTAFIVAQDSQDYLITNWHNVSGRDPITKKPLHPSLAIPNDLRVYYPVANKLDEWTPVVLPLYAGDTELWHTHPVHHEVVDVAVLPVSINTSEIATYPYGLNGISGHGAKDLPCKPRLWPGQNLFIPGYPFGRTAGGRLAIWLRASLASEDFIDYEDLPLFLVDARTRQGQSGSPVILYHAGGFTVLEDGRSYMIQDSFTWLLGVYSGRLSEESDIGRVWKSSAIQEIIDAIEN